MEDEERSGRPSEAVTEDNVELVRGMIQVDPRVTYEMIESLDIHPPQIHRISHEFIGVRKRTARWVPRQLTEEQKAARVEWCIFMKEKFRNSSARVLENVITGDETWIYQFEPEKKKTVSSLDVSWRSAACEISQDSKLWEANGFDVFQLRWLCFNICS